MKILQRLVIYLAIASGFFGPSYVLRAQPAPPPHDSQAAFEFACKLMQYDCSNIEPPGIVWVGMYHAMGVVGGYDGSQIIYMDTDVLRFADEVFIQSVLAHETTHYLDVQLGHVVPPWTKDVTCQSEFNGWRVGNAYVVIHGREDLADFSWAERYRCFQ